MAVEVRQLGDEQLEERVGGAKIQAMDQVYCGRPHAPNLVPPVIAWLRAGGQIGHGRQSDGKPSGRGVPIEFAPSSRACCRPSAFDRGGSATGWAAGGGQFLAVWTWRGHGRFRPHGPRARPGPLHGGLAPQRRW